AALALGHRRALRSARSLRARWQAARARHGWRRLLHVRSEQLNSEAANKKRSAGESAERFLLLQDRRSCRPSFLGTLTFSVYDRIMSSDRALLHSLVDSLPEAEIAAAVSLLSELTVEEEIDSETAGRLDRARREQGEDVPLAQIRARLGL